MSLEQKLLENLNCSRREFIKLVNTCLQILISFKLVNLSYKKVQAQEPNKKFQSISEIPAAELIKMFNSEKPTQEIAELFREYFQLPPNQEIIVIAKTDGSGVYGPVFVAKVFENGIDTKKRYLAFTFFPSILEGFKGIVFIDTSNFAVSGIEVQTVPSTFLKPCEKYTININIQSTDMSGNLLEPRYNLVVQIGQESKTYILSKEELVQIFGSSFTGANLYWFTKLN